MSGGSYDYACFADDLRSFIEKRSNLRDMAEALYDAGDADDVAADLDGLIAFVDNADQRVTARLKRLSNVMHALEWWHSSDYSEDQFRKALKEYRGEDLA